MMCEGMAEHEVCFMASGLMNTFRTIIASTPFPASKILAENSSPR